MFSRLPLSGLWLIVLGGLALAGCATASRSGQAAGQISRAGETDPESEKRISAVAHYATGLSHELNDQPDQALEEMVRAAQTDLSSEPIVIEAVQRCIRAHQPEKAIELLTKATALPNASGTLYAWLGLAYAQAGKTDLAISANRTSIKKMPQSLTPYQNLAQVYLQNSRTNDALQVLDEAARQPVDNPGYLIELADLYVRYGRIQGQSAIKTRVEALLDRAADMAPASPIQILRLADTYFAVGELTKAEPFYRELLEEHPEWPDVNRRLAEIYLRSDRKEKAAEQLEKLARLDPTNPQVYLVIGAIAVEEKNYKQAAEQFERAIRLDPDLEEVYYELAGLKLQLKKPEEARTLLDQARSRFKLSFPMEFYTALAYHALEDYPEALKYLTSAEAIARATEPSRLTHLFYFQMAVTNERAGRMAESEKYFRECLKLSPDDPETLNYLGYMWAEKGVNLEEAQRFIDKAVRQQPDNSAFLDSQAWVLYKLQRPRDALAPMLKAIEHSEAPDPTLFDHLGDIYGAMGQHEKAREAWGQALKLKPNEQIEQKLKAAPTVSPAP
jgi:tetratricopeptide (TPR) repeat protein